MTRKVFVDTGAWLALADTGDGLHDAAIASYPTVLEAGSRLVTTNLVVAESYNLIRRRLGHSPAMSFLESLRASPRLIKIYSDADTESAAEDILLRYDDQDFSFVDAVSFAVMQQEGIAEAFAFDRHFAAAGFTLVPG
jgi:hypothetical protein